MKLIKKTLKKEIAQRLSASVKLKGVREADVSDLWIDNAEELQNIFKSDEWEFLKVNGRVKFCYINTR